MILDEKLAAKFARIALSHVGKPYPYKMDHVLLGDEDALPPRALHPIFFGSFDWHSCVHGWWTLLTISRLYPETGEAQAIADLAGASFTADKVAIELAYLRRPLSAGFERPYGWGWLLYLHLEASRHSNQEWAANLEPLARAFADRLHGFLPRLTYPIRVGTHFNTCFALILALEWAEQFDAVLARNIRRWAVEKFSNDRDCQAWEPGGDEFLSPALIEALCMARVLAAGDFARWFAAFLPRLADREPEALFAPATVSDRSDGKIAHLDGLNLSRAWCWRSIAPLLPAGEKAIAEAAATKHLDAALPHVAGDYMGEHWLASFALLALQAGAG
ncbi:DUF2891 domain-containing protein [Sphingomonas sp. RB56-2]|uniref:DUF2891 domain-containing protein n=1 Tax=Sphingomonas brevis TaxID=2908206 RepID=A0ABT0S9G0_9SPHN|nr:DUF2891 domain-containing protein [Sphingomonas brevis]MCL6741017.1 DUF2891 domain-containing protein [Sphingomonas brevis]